MKISKEEELQWRTPPKRTKKETEHLLAEIKKDTAKVRAMIKKNGGRYCRKEFTISGNIYEEMK